MNNILYQKQTNLELSQRISNAFRELLQSRHLYQSITLQYEDALKILEKHVSRTSPDLVVRSRSRFNGLWIPGSFGSEDAAAITFVVPDCRLFCKRCDRLEPFNHSSTQVPVSEEMKGIQPTIQIFTPCFICQGCKGSPQTFLVRREGVKLTLSGRSPMEEVHVPKVIPKPVVKYFSGAVIAHQSGQTLAGNFLFRTLVEQFARSCSGSDATTADKVLSDYMEILPISFKERFPSLQEMYGKLSEDIHNARGSIELFVETSALLIKHFDARRVFELPDTPISPVEVAL